MKLSDYVNWEPEPPGSDRSLANIVTVKTSAVHQDVVTPSKIRTITARMLAMSTLPLPIPRMQVEGHKKPKDYMLWLVGIVASVVSICATVYYYNAHEILLYEDAKSHERIARGVFDSLTPSIVQLGSVWLPLPHILMWPFIWNDGLWHSGLAGSFVAMPCYVIASMCIYLIIKHITASIVASLLGTSIFALNANILYLQSTPLSEIVCIATYLLVVYCFLLWTDSNATRHLALVGAATFFATLARYDSWPLALALLFVIPFYGIIQHKKKEQIVAETLIYALPGFFGIILWLVWNVTIFGDLFYFARGPYSSTYQEGQYLAAHHLVSYHDLWGSIKTYGVDAIRMMGPILSLCSIFFICLTLLGKYRTPQKLALLLLLAPFAFYVYSLYGGQAVIWIPGATPQGLKVYMYNVRYGVQMIAPSSIFLATGISIVRNIPWEITRKITWGCILVSSLVYSSSLLFLSSGITLQEGQYYVMCSSTKNINNYMYQHYDKGLILSDVATLDFDTTVAGINFKNVIYQGSQHYWTEALDHPERMVDWIVLNSNNRNDLVAQHIRLNNLTFLTNFTLVAKQSDGALLFHHTGLPPLPNRAPIPQYSYPHAPCLH